MSTTTVVRSIDAPIALVFKTVAEIENFRQAVPHITKVEFLSEQKVGVGARFRETRLMKGREASSELEVTSYVQDEHIRLVSDQGGTLWDTVFTVVELGGQVELKMVMEARAYKLAAKLFNPLIKGMIRKAIEQDMDAVKAHCERA
jgi:carbon monoxide dehydrogenase subunit G